jgi:hypothetical protein
MFCRLLTDDRFIIVEPSFIGKFVYFVTFGAFRPSIMFSRDFGLGSSDGKCLSIKPPCSVTVIGNLYDEKIENRNEIA